MAELDRLGLPREPVAADLARIPEAVLKRSVVVTLVGDLEQFRTPVALESVCGVWRASGATILREVLPRDRSCSGIFPLLL